MIELKDVLTIHNILIEKFGGSKGVRDSGSLESAINRPFATFNNQDLYLTPSAKAAAILESILINHPFIDGNKRTARLMANALLLSHSCTPLSYRSVDENEYREAILVFFQNLNFL